MRIITGLAVLVIILSGCSDKKPPSETRQTAEENKPSVSINNETRLLIKDLADNGDYVNSREFPSLIKASVVHDELAGNIHIIDLRDAASYKKGHIKNAVNKKFTELPDYFESVIKPFQYDRIILVCDDGQISSYATSLMRLMGYGNVFAMRWGMSSWNKSFAQDNWLSGLSSEFEGKLEKATHEKTAAITMPELKTGLTTGAEISNERFHQVFAQGTDEVLVSAGQVFADPAKFYIINYERKDKYDDGHIPGAVRYKPNATLGFVDEMATIPIDKPVVVYCGTGHNSAFATAYLRLMGYNAMTLKYGNNAFMHDWMAKDAASLSWLPFSERDINNFEVVK